MMKMIFSMIGAVALCLTPAYAKIYVKFTGGNPTTNGESSAEDRANWIDATNISFGMERLVTSGTSGGGGAASQTVLHRFLFDKSTDKASTALMTNAALGAIYTGVVIEVTKLFGQTEKVIFKIELKNVKVEKILSDFNDGDDNIIERVTLAYEAQRITTYSINSQTGAVTESGVHRWNTMTNTPVF